ncbi:hypothetical protein GLW07_00065 [Bacillus hwajinpoensis]|uniref:Uncharacterized protein n=1 Tax=Guptibacillus hwajinpoensis TaxID=208199 RepID=A0A845ETL9_9BACL|nr:hypothetical protein [Pseudalkalibacillus hwajinpoensis]MYL61736.1 hypothetical protein [Pseudalkalibacillus hwajinpoensis]QHA93205.1 hypothetical protein GNK04_18155 [Bacillus sp. N1-1]
MISIEREICRSINNGHIIYVGAALKKCRTVIMSLTCNGELLIGVDT